MIIINNQTTEQGSVLYMQTDIPALGVTALISFTDDTVGEGISTYYKKTFQISRNGITWSDWKELTIGNIQAMTVSKYDKLFIKYRYEHVGPGILEFNSNVMTGMYDTQSAPVQCPYYFRDSIFKKYFDCNDLEVIKWYLNVSEKLYSGGLNKYIRFDNGDGDESHAIDFWQSVAKFFAFYVILARVYRGFYLREDLLNSYLVQRGLFTSTFNILTELNDLMKNFNNEMFRRGTSNILNKKSNGNLFDGELRRYLNVRQDDEFVFNYFLPHHCGWWADRSSPMYRGLEEHLNANKLKFEDYMLSGAYNISVNPNDKNDITLQLSAGNLQYDLLSTDKLIPVNFKNNYVFEFMAKVNSASTIDLGVECFDNLNQIISNATVDFKTNANSSSFLTSFDLSRFVGLNVWVPIKCIIYNVSKPSPFTQDQLNIGAGNNLKFANNIDIAKIYPILTVNGDVEIKDIYFRQLYTEYERGFISMNHFISILYDFDKSTQQDDITGFQYDFNFNF